MKVETHFFNDTYLDKPKWNFKNKFYFNLFSFPGRRPPFLFP